MVYIEAFSRRNPVTVNMTLDEAMSRLRADYFILEVMGVEYSEEDQLRVIQMMAEIRARQAARDLLLDYVDKAVFHNEDPVQ